MSISDLALNSFQVFPRTSQDPQLELSHTIFNIEFKATFSCWKDSMLYFKAKEDVLAITHDQLMEHRTFEPLICNKLSSMEVNVSECYHIIGGILGCARNMDQNPQYIGQKIFYMSMKIQSTVTSPLVNVDDGTWMPFDEYSDRLDEFREADISKVMTSASEDSIQKLESVNATTSALCNDCVICMEEIGVGSKARRMPCKHLFHGDCIVTWLRKSNSCPLCRLELP